MVFQSDNVERTWWKFWQRRVMCTTLISMLFWGTPVSSTNEPDHQYIAVGNHYITNQCLLKIALFVLRNIAYNFILHLTDHCQWDASGSGFYIQDYLYVQNKNKVNNIYNYTDKREGWAIWRHNFLRVNQTVWILWWGDPFESWVKVIYAKVQHWPHIILKNNARHRIKTIY